MRFKDPVDCLCHSCNTTSLASVARSARIACSLSSLRSVTARENGLEMTKLCDRVFTSQLVASLLTRIEEQVGNPLPDSALDDLFDREELTIYDLCEIFDRHATKLGSVNSTEMVLAAIQWLCPELDGAPELHVPLLKALKICPDYAASYQ